MFEDRTMRKVSDLFGKNVSVTASKAAVDALFAQDNGTEAYSLFGKILALCGAGWLLITLVPFFCGTKLSEWIWMLIVGIIQIVVGIIFVILAKKSLNFQKWANKDFEKELKNQKKYKEKVRIKLGKDEKPLPITYGDVLAFKLIVVCIIIVMFFFFLLWLS